MAIKLSTVSADQTIADLGNRTFTHPTVDYDLVGSGEFTEDEVKASANLQALVTGGDVTLKDGNDNPITNLENAGPHNHKKDAITDFAHASDHTDGTDDIQNATAGQKGLATTAQVSKLNGIENGATADQTGGEIKSLYEGEANTNAFTDSEKSKVANLISGDNKLDATGDPTADDDSADTSGNGTFSIGSLWVNITDDKAFRCVDATPTAAVWIKTTLSTSELATIALTGQTSDLIGTLVTNQYTNNSVIYEKMQNISATARLLGRKTAGAGNVEELDASEGKTLLGLDNVTNDAQLKRSSGDMNLFAEKTTPVDDDILLMEDSAASYAKKKLKMSNLPGGGASDFTDLDDTPGSYSGQAGKFPQVNSGEDALEFVTGGRLSKIFQGIDTTGGMKVTNVAQVIALNYESLKDNYYAHSTTVNPGEVEILAAGWYKISAMLTVATVSAAGGTRGNPQLHIEIDSGSGFVEQPDQMGGYIREDGVLNLSTSITGIGFFEFDVGDKFRLTTYDTVIAEPDEETVPYSSRLVVEFEDRSGTGGVTVNNLKDVGDVDAAAPSENDHLVFNSSSEWENRAYPKYHGAINKTTMEAISSPGVGDWCVCTTYEGKRFNFDGEVWVVPGEVVRVENRTGGARIEGDVVVLDGTIVRAADVTIILDDLNVLGAVVSGGPSGSGNYISVAIAGLPWSVKVSGPANISDGIFTHTTATQAYASGSAFAGSFGQTLESKGIGVALISCWVKSKEVY